MKSFLLALGAIFLFSLPTTATSGIVKKSVKVVVAAKIAKKIYVNSKLHPESAKHIKDAQKAGAPKTLTVDRQGAAERRKAALKGKSTAAGKDRDEYPPAMTKEGGENASVRLIGKSDNRGSGACIGAQCRGVKDGEQVRIVVRDK